MSVTVVMPSDAPAIKLRRIQEIGARVIIVGPGSDERAQRAAELEETEAMDRTAADGLRVQQVGAIPWPHLQAFIDDAVTVSEDEIRTTARAILDETGLIAEPSGAVSVAAARAATGSDGTGRRVAVLTGSNTDQPEHRGQLRAQAP